MGSGWSVGLFVVCWVVDGGLVGSSLVVGGLVGGLVGGGWSVG